MPFNQDRCCHLALCLWLILFHCIEPFPSVSILCSSFLQRRKKCKEKKAMAFTRDGCCHLAFCLWLILFHCTEPSPSVSIPCSSLLRYRNNHSHKSFIVRALVFLESFVILWRNKTVIFNLIFLTAGGNKKAMVLSTSKIKTIKLRLKPSWSKHAVRCHVLLKLKNVLS